MPPLLNISIHQSQFPGAVQNQLVNCLRAKDIQPKFLYDSVRQAARWIALHKACSPSQTDPACARVYEDAFAAIVRQVRHHAQVCVVGLGCGTGQKEALLLDMLGQHVERLTYLPVDVSVPLLIRAATAASGGLEDKPCLPLICDLRVADDLPQVVTELSGEAGPRVLTCFGLLPNLEPGVLIGKLAELLRAEDYLLLSANLAPGSNYERGVEEVLPQYGNTYTREWLMAFLIELGFDIQGGDLSFCVTADSEHGLRRIEAWFRFREAKSIDVHGERITFSRGESLRMFFSYRYTPARLTALLGQYRLAITEQFLTRSGEEGVFLVRR